MGSHVAGKATVRYFGGAKAAAGTRMWVVAVPVGASVDDLIYALAIKHGDAR
jgi:sulfur-carrier protein